MYETFFKLREKPFNLNPDPAYLYLSRRHRAALTMLEYGLEGQAGFVVLTGEVGSGKTTLIRQFLRSAKERVTVGVISNTHQTFGNLMEWITQSFGLETGGRGKVELYADFVRFLEEVYRGGSRVVLVVDEAQNMSVETLEELRLLSNVNVEKELMLQTVLVGQPELLEKLRRPELAQFAQRVAVDYHLERLTYRETRNYIQHRLRVAGGSPAIFNTEAIGGIYYFSDGVPRVINTLCDSALVYAYADNKSQVDVATILAVAADRRTGLMKSIGEQYQNIDRMNFQSALERFGSYEKEEQKLSDDRDGDDESEFADEPPRIVEQASKMEGPPPAGDAVTTPRPTPAARLFGRAGTAGEHRDVPRRQEPLKPLIAPPRLDLRRRQRPNTWWRNFF